MLKFACAGWGFRECSLLEYLAAAKKLGLDFVELNLGENETDHLNPSDSEDDLKLAAQQAVDAGGQIVALAGSNDFTLAGATARQKQIDRVKRQIDICATLGAEVLRIFAGWTPAKQVTDETFAWVRECLDKLGPYASANNVVLALENHGGITKTGAECMRLVQGLPAAVGLNYDPANFRHCDEDPLAALIVIADRVVYSHWKDVRLIGDQWEYCAVGEGVIAWEPIVAKLATSYEGYWAIEYEEPADVEQGTKASLQYLKQSVGHCC